MAEPMTAALLAFAISQWKLHQGEKENLGRTLGRVTEVDMSRQHGWAIRAREWPSLILLPMAMELLGQKEERASEVAKKGQLQHQLCEDCKDPPKAPQFLRPYLFIRKMKIIVRESIKNMYERALQTINLSKTTEYLKVSSIGPLTDEMDS